MRLKGKGRNCGDRLRQIILKWMQMVIILLKKKAFMGGYRLYISEKPFHLLMNI